jgi:hypothetical protein
MTDDRFTRLAVLSGLVSAVVLALNAGRRAGLLPNTALLHGVAPLAETAGLIVLTGLYLHQRDTDRGLGLAGYAAGFVGLSGLLGAEFVTNLIFPAVGAAETKTLLAGPTGVEFTVAAVVFLAGTVAFGAALYRRGALPRAATVAYVAGGVVISLRAFEPTSVLVAGLLATAVGVGWLSVALGRRVAVGVS